MRLKFESQAQDLVVIAMKSNDPEERSSAVSAAVSRRLDIPDTLIDSLADHEPEIRQLARRALVQLIKTDFGPQPDADQTTTNQAILEWKRWRVLMKFPKFRNAKNDDLIVSMKTDNFKYRWAAVIAVRQKKSRLGSNLIDLLADPEKVIQQESRFALVQLAKGADLGPNKDATNTEVAESIRQWTVWWQNESEKAAAQKLQLAKLRFRENPLAGRERLTEIVDQFPNTKAAKEAEILLGRQ